MLSTFFGLELARRGLEAQQIALDVTGHNIANSNTTGYTRQIANLQATTPNLIAGLGKQVSIGTGVTLDDILRARDDFVDRQFRLETSKQEYWSSKADVLSKIQDIFNESSDDSISGDLSKFWTAWSDLSKNPENSGARSVVKERALALTDSFHHVAQQLEDMKSEMDDNVRVQISQINGYAEQIKNLNNQIKRAEVAGDNPNDLQDQRDKLVDELSKIVNVKVVEQRDPGFKDRMVNSYAVIIGDESTAPPQYLVNDSEVNLLAKPPAKGADGLPYATVTWGSGPQAGQVVELGKTAGTLQANIEMRDNYLVSTLNQFNTLAQGIANAMNALHQTGQGTTAETGTIGIDFFTDGTNTSVPPALPTVTAANISLNSVLLNDVSRIATGTIPIDSGPPATHSVDPNTGLPLVNSGDGSVASAIATLANGWASLQTQINAGRFGAVGTNPVPATSFIDYYSANTAQMGVDVQAAERMSSGQGVLVNHLANQRESISGVSLDEEMTNLVKFQKSYAASARLVTMMDDMLDTIVNGMGVTR